MSGWRWAGGVLLLTAIVTACQERLTSPADCPALCPGGSVEVFDTIVPVVQNRDSSFPVFADRASGYVDRGGGPALLVSNGFAASEDRAVYRFAPRSDSLVVRDTLRAYTVDSVTFNLSLIARDTLVNGLKVYLYRLPSSVDNTTTFADVDAQLVDINLIDSIAVPDSVNTGTLTTTLRGADVARVELPPGGDSVLAIGLRIAAETPTGIRVGSLASSTGANYTSYVTVDVPDTGSTRRQSLSRVAAFNTFVTQDPVIPDDRLLTVGGEPSSRALLRFGLSDEFLDSSTIVRATLELTPVRPIIGLPTDPTLLQIVPVIGDLGAKSPLTEVGTLIRTDSLPSVQSDTLRVEVTRIVELWQSDRTSPQSIFIRVPSTREAATFARAVFHSTRTPLADPSIVAPRLRITYQRSFPFENP
ncbi:MAG TPA: hypothetical protein VMY76_06320 [Gemmatimonadales bacterium]|nr:hypothetical protein [Gemmatimonadales bacterium]